jgi:predicted nucleic acid-binding Zn ribbon protein
MTSDEDAVEDVSAADPQPSGADAARAALARARAQARTRPAAASTKRSSSWAVRRGGSVGDERRSGAGPDDRDPQTLGSVVDRVAQDQNWADPLSIGTVIARWPLVVGEPVAQHVEPASLREGVLTVQADSTTWATEMKLQAASVLRRLDEELGADVVRSVVVLGPAGPSWKKGRRSVPGRGPRDTYG